MFGFIKKEFFAELTVISNINLSTVNSTKMYCND